MTNFMPIAKAESVQGLGYGAGPAQLARWVLMLLGWVWLGEQGIKLGWLYASGVWPLVVWWVSRLCVRYAAATITVSGPLLLIAGLAAALCLFVAPLVALTTHTVLLLVAVCWGVTCGVADATKPAKASQLPGSVCAPVAAAALVAAMWLLPGAWSWQAAAVVMACCSLLLTLNDGCLLVLTARVPALGQAHDWSLGLPPVAMGLMMGTLWQSSAWCAGLGWSATANLFAHLLLMGVLPGIAVWLARRLSFARQTRNLYALVFLAVGALLLSAAPPSFWLAGMLLQTLSWALHQTPYQALSSPYPQAVRPHALSDRSFMWLGPAVLLFIGLTLQEHGPLVLVSVQVCILLFAGLGLSAHWRDQRLYANPYSP